MLACMVVLPRFGNIFSTYFPANYARSSCLHAERDGEEQDVEVCNDGKTRYRIKTDESTKQNHNFKSPPFKAKHQGNGQSKFKICTQIFENSPIGPFDSLLYLLDAE